MLTGVLYFHRISDRRVGGISRKNFTMFRKLCGEMALRNLFIVTNMWGDVDLRIGEAREAQLMKDDLFFKPVLDSGARMARHDDTASSAERIIRLVLENHPLPLRIQEELVTEGKDITRTEAGEELNRELNAQIGRYQKDIDETMKEMQQAMKGKDEEVRRELEIEIQRMKTEIYRFQNDRERLESDYRKEKERLKELADRLHNDGDDWIAVPIYR